MRNAIATKTIILDCYGQRGSRKEAKGKRTLVKSLVSPLVESRTVGFPVALVTSNSYGHGDVLLVWPCSLQVAGELDASCQKVRHL